MAKSAREVEANRTAARITGLKARKSRLKLQLLALPQSA